MNEKQYGNFNLEAHKLNKKEKSLSRGLLVPRCRSPPFFA